VDLLLQPSKAKRFGKWAGSSFQPASLPQPWNRTTSEARTTRKNNNPRSTFIGIKVSPKIFFI
jgi:hypothetical protein